MRKIVIASIAGLLLAGGFVWLQTQRGGEKAALASDDGPSAPSDTLSQESGAAKEEVRVPVELARAAAVDLPAYFHATGALEAQREVDLIAKTQGQITRLHVEEGDRLKEGQVLAELEHEEQQLQLERAKVMAETAQLELARTQDMFERGLATDRELEEKRQTAKVNRYDQDLTDVRLQERIVRAPFDGVLTVRHVEVGQTVSVGEKLFGLADVSPMEVRLYLPEKVVCELRIGQPVEIRPDVQDDETALVGVVDRIAPVVDSATSTVKVTLRVDGRQPGLRVGTFVRARITTDVHEGAVAIPKRAIVPEAGANFVFVAEADSVRKVEVVTGYSDEHHIEILEGLTLEQSVVVVGQGGLREGSRIRDLNALAPEVAPEESAQSSQDSKHVASLGG